ncbi:MAG: phosphoribosylformylglycinamidine synthase [Defluviitaleaceae bacterium]|nr:phosphoribosylformylglycinamidine synthase [Defluviitaleaceae bacterium]
MENMRIFVEKKDGFNIEAKKMLAHVQDNLGIMCAADLRIFHCYDVKGLTKDEFDQFAYRVLAEANVDNATTTLDTNGFVFGKALLPGQYDQRADWAAQCAQVITGKLPVIQYTKFHVVMGDLSETDKTAILKDTINPVDSRQIGLDDPVSFAGESPRPADVESVDIINKNDDELTQVYTNMGMAMNFDDFAFLRNYFRDTEQRNPTITELRMIDTYWSDHCRHTTFHTTLENVEITDGPYKELFQQTFEDYKALRAKIYAGKDRPISLMDMATVGTKILRQQGLLDDLDVSEEINAASIVIDVEIEGGENEEWLLMFKNETHNHPTEVEPFGGAATCLGGAIRDPLSGRAYVYQAMRLSGCADPTNPNTLEGKLPQRLITTQAGAGYSSYGNQMGLATGLVNEIYHEGYRAKRMEIGAVVGAVKKSHVVRKRPEAGDVVLLIGGRTGRDGVGGATGSSKSHDEKSLENIGAEVQKGNPVIQRKLQRLFRNPEAIKLIIRCNDFGAGGVSVAVGELADSLEINLDAVKKKYDGLDGTELAISESQERMAAVVHAKDADRLIQLAFEENLEAYEVAKITDTGRLVMMWRGQKIVDVSREFLDTAGITQKATVRLCSPLLCPPKDALIAQPSAVTKEKWLSVLGDLNVASQKGLVENFDPTVGAGTVLAPFGGKHQLTPAHAMAARIPVLYKKTGTASMMSFGLDPYISEQSPYHGAVYAVVQSVARLVAHGADYSKVRLSFQEYFEKLTSPESWGKPFAALLGAFAAQMGLGIPAIGGKDSMSGTFKNIHVPPTLASFSAVATPIADIISPEFKVAGNTIALMRTKQTEYGLPCYNSLKENFARLHSLILDKKIISARVVGFGGIAAAISEMAFGNKIGVEINYNGDMFNENTKEAGLFLLEVACGNHGLGLETIGKTVDAATLNINGITICMEECIKAWMRPLEGVFPTGMVDVQEKVLSLPTPHKNKEIYVAKNKIAKPTAFIPVFPGSNCEYDIASAFIGEGAQVDMMVINNLTLKSFEASVAEMAKRIAKAQIIAIPGGFSAGDEPEGSGKFIAAIFANPAITEATHQLIYDHEGLVIGICNGFQALVKMGLLPFGKISPLMEDSPTLAVNSIGRHISNFAITKVHSNKSPWLSGVDVGDIHRVAASHGQGRFVSTPEVAQKLFDNGQVVTTFVNQNGNPVASLPYNPNGAYMGIEGIVDTTGRILGKMCHSERGEYYKNIPGNFNQKVFNSGVRYFN